LFHFHCHRPVHNVLRRVKPLEPHMFLPVGTVMRSHPFAHKLAVLGFGIGSDGTQPAGAQRSGHQSSWRLEVS
jgi:hypothetical protein